MNRQTDKACLFVWLTSTSHVWMDQLLEKERDLNKLLIRFRGKGFLKERLTFW